MRVFEKAFDISIDCPAMRYYFRSDEDQKKKKTFIVTSDRSHCENAYGFLIVFFFFYNFFYINAVFDRVVWFESFSKNPFVCPHRTTTEILHAVWQAVILYYYH